MAPHWHGLARKHGYDPEGFSDAKKGEGFTITIAMKHMRGAVIGDGEQCSGARCLNDQPDIEWAYVGASSAFVTFKDGRKRRYLVNGMPKSQDRTMNVAGEQLILRPPSRTQTMAAQRKRLKAAKPDRHGKKDKDGTKSKGHTINQTLTEETAMLETAQTRRGRSLAAQLRNHDPAPVG